MDTEESVLLSQCREDLEAFAVIWRKFLRSERSGADKAERDAKLPGIVDRLEQSLVGKELDELRAKLRKIVADEQALINREKAVKQND